MRILVTGGLGFIGSALVRHLVAETTHEVINLDARTYAATTGSTAEAAGSPRYSLRVADLRDRASTRAVFEEHEPEAVMHLAAESHVDRSIDGPADFVNTNLVGTFNLLEAAREAGVERFLHVSTDEVFGSLSVDDPAFTEETPYAPRSPYSASKAGADHLARAWHETFDLPVLVTNCSNNYGPFHFPEKLIPLMIIRSMAGQELPVYGQGDNIRDWLFVEDHVRALTVVLESGTPGDTYNVGGDAERTNLEVVHTICDLVDDSVGRLDGGGSRRELIRFVEDRPGHDLRYSIDHQHLTDSLGWQPSVSFEEGARRTVEWFVTHQDWWGPLVERQATDRRGLTRN